MQYFSLILLIATVAYCTPVESGYKCGQSSFPYEKQDHGGGERIVKGTPVPQGKYPWLVALMAKSRPSGQTLHQCTATIVSPKYLLIATHCIVDFYSDPPYPRLNPSDYYAAVGNVNCTSPEVQRIELKRFIDNPSFVMNRHDGGAINDIGLIELQTPLTFSANVQPICVSGNQQRSDPKRTVVMTGWGNIVEGGYPQFPDILQEATAHVAKDKTCKREYEDYKPKPMICIAGTNGSQASGGDSGGPALIHVGDSQSGYWTEIGVTSYGSGVTGVYTRVSHFCQWISENSNGEVKCSQ